MSGLIGHTPDGKPVAVWSQKNAWTGADESFLEVGRELIQLDHLAPGLEDSLRASLHREAS